MRRSLFVLVSAVAAVGALAIPAHAKGPVESAKGTVVITGPGLPRPIQLDGKVEGFQEPGDGFMAFQSDSDGEFSAFLFASAMLSPNTDSAAQFQGWYTLPPRSLRDLGPAYRMRLDLSGQGWSESLTRQIYPFAPERPLVFTPAESLPETPRVTMQHLRGLWWSAPSSLLSILQAHGLPKTAPALAEPPAAAPAAPASPQGWVFLWTAAALLGLLVAGVIAGRRGTRAA